MKTFLILLILVVLPMAVLAEGGWHDGDDVGWNGPNNQARVLSQTSVGDVPENIDTPCPCETENTPADSYITTLMSAGGCVITAVGQDAIVAQIMICLGVNPIGGGIIWLGD